MYHYHDNWNENSLSFALRIEAQITNARQNLDIGGKIYTLGTIPNNWVKKGEQCETTEKLSQNATEITKFYDSPAAPGLYCAAVQGESHNSSARKIKLVWRITKWLTQRWLIRWSIEKSSSVQSSQLLPEGSALGPWGLTLKWTGQLSNYGSFET